jgi:alkaline phosphatase
MITKKCAYLLPLLIFFSGCAGNRQAGLDLSAPPKSNRAKNIILLIGDGMALTQVSANIYWQGLGKSIFEQFKIVGFHKSHSADDLVTDSAAGATAFSCGHKTTNGSLAVLPPDNRPCQTILEMLSAKGWATGMVVACSATHATPAAFIAHRESRAFTDDIALDYLNTPLDCFVGGGEHSFYDRPDKINLEDSLHERGYIIRKGTSFRKLPLDGSSRFFLFTDDREPGTASAGRDYMPEATQNVCDYLSKRSKNGFFLMVEGSQIDWGGHSNDKNWLRAEMLDFDEVVRKALEFAVKDGETLVLVTGDHECGGLAMNPVLNKHAFLPVFSTRLHTAALVPVYAYGPQAGLFSGIYDNTKIYEKMRTALGMWPE